MILTEQQLGRYHVSRLIGSGGMGEVYLARDVQVERMVAVKVLRNDAFRATNPTETEEAFRLFRREARAIARLDHPHILTLYDYGEAVIQGNPIAYMVMPFCPAGSLETWLQRYAAESVLAPQVTIHLLHQAGEALQYAHHLAIIHRDVKPANFLIRGQSETLFPNLLLADFGIASLSGTGETTLAGRICGSPGYMAPEQWEGRVGPETDQYGLAVMAYQLLTGKMPFEGNQYQVMYKHRYMEPIPPSQVNPALSKDIDAVILRALAKEPQQRFSNVQEFAVALEQAQQRLASDQLKTTLLAKPGATQPVQSEATQPAQPKKQESKFRFARNGFLLALLVGCIAGILCSLPVFTPSTIAGRLIVLLVTAPLLSLIGGAATGKVTRKRRTGFATGLITGIAYLVCIRLYALHKVDPTKTYTISIRALQSMALNNVVIPMIIIALLCGLFGLIGSWLMTRKPSVKSKRSYPLPTGRRKYALLAGVIAGALCGVTVATAWEYLGFFLLCPVLCIVVGIVAGKVAIQRTTGFIAGMILGAVYIAAFAIREGSSYTQGYLNGFTDGSPDAQHLATLLGAYLIATVVIVFLIVCLCGLLSLLGAWLTTLKHPYYAR